MHPLIQQSFILCNHPSTSTRQAICTIFKGKPLFETALGDINLTKPCPGMHWLVIIVFGAASQTTLILDKTHFSHQALWLGGKYFWERSVLADYKQTRLVDEKGCFFVGRLIWKHLRFHPISPVETWTTRLGTVPLVIFLMFLSFLFSFAAGCFRLGHAGERAKHESCRRQKCSLPMIHELFLGEHARLSPWKPSTCDMRIRPVYYLLITADGGISAGFLLFCWRRL